MGPVMAVGWVVCAGLIYALIPALSFLSSLAIAACLTPTDPILAAAGERFPLCPSLYITEHDSESSMVVMLRNTSLNIFDIF